MRKLVTVQMSCTVVKGLFLNPKRVPYVILRFFISLAIFLDLMQVNSNQGNDNNNDNGNNDSGFIAWHSTRCFFKAN